MINMTDGRVIRQFPNTLNHYNIHRLEQEHFAYIEIVTMNMVALAAHNERSSSYRSRTTLQI